MGPPLLVGSAQELGANSLGIGDSLNRTTIHCGKLSFQHPPSVLGGLQRGEECVELPTLLDRVR